MTQTEKWTTMVIFSVKVSGFPKMFICKCLYFTCPTGSEFYFSFLLYFFSEILDSCVSDLGACQSIQLQTVMYDRNTHHIPKIIRYENENIFSSPVSL